MHAGIRTVLRGIQPFTVKINAEILLVLSFILVILLGSLLLYLPFAHVKPISYLDCLFTSTSAVCVTGLIVKDTGQDFTPAGQGIILLLIQLGGLGLMTFVAFFSSLFNRRLSLNSKAAIYGVFFQRDMARDFKKIILRILLLTGGIELAGACVLFARIGKPFSALFHSISAFCNAGFSLYPTSFMAFHTDPWIMAAIILLIVAGGIGYIVYFDLFDGLRNKWRFPKQRVYLTLHSRLALVTTGVLIVGGTVAVLVFGMNSQGDWPQKILDSLFQSVTARTAGFNSVDIAHLPVATLMILALLMFIGGSPGSCAGGIKTTTCATFTAFVYQRLKGKKSTHLFGRRIASSSLEKITVLLALSVAWNVLGAVLLPAFESAAEGIHLQHLVFEQLSAFGTVGLSTGITPSLCAASKIWLILTMFLGRLGPLTVAVVAVSRKAQLYDYPEGTILIG